MEKLEELEVYLKELDTDLATVNIPTDYPSVDSVKKLLFFMKGHWYNLEIMKNWWRIKTGNIMNCGMHRNSIIMQSKIDIK